MARGNLDTILQAHSLRQRPPRSAWFQPVLLKAEVVSRQPALCAQHAVESQAGREQRSFTHRQSGSHSPARDYRFCCVCEKDRARPPTGHRHSVTSSCA
jgi:hypothetical protein